MSRGEKKKRNRALYRTKAKLLESGVDIVSNDIPQDEHAVGESE